VAPSATPSGTPTAQPLPTLPNVMTSQGGTSTGTAATATPTGTATPAGSATPANSNIPTNPLGEQYPQLVDPLTGQPIVFPQGIPHQMLRDDDPRKAVWTNTERQGYKDWFMPRYEAVYGGPPPAGWDNYWKTHQIHHIVPRSFGGSNDPSNLVPVPVSPMNDHGQYTTWWVHWADSTNPYVGYTSPYVTRRTP
jgi:hypothetical protein